MCVCHILCGLSLLCNLMVTIGCRSVKGGPTVLVLNIQMEIGDHDDDGTDDGDHSDYNIDSDQCDCDEDD